MTPIGRRIFASPPDSLLVYKIPSFWVFLLKNTLFSIFIENKRKTNDPPLPLYIEKIFFAPPDYFY